MDAPRAFDVFASACPSRRAFDAIFSRWGILVLARLLAGEARFGEVKAGVDGISDRLLTQTLRGLEDEGLVARHPRGNRVDYALTPRGQRLARALGAAIDELYSGLGEAHSEA